MTRTAMLLAVLLAGCTITATREAPVRDRSIPPVVTAPPTELPPKPAAPRAAPADGQYTVQPGDTLYSIAATFGRDVKDVARWNNIDDPAVIRVGQVLRVVPPTADQATVMPVTPGGPTTARPLEGTTALPAPAAPGTGDAEPAPPGPLASIPPEVKPPAATGDWIWPASGRVIATFDKKKRMNGISISGKEGDPVVASADGEVIYSGSGLRGYGKLIILKHSGGYVTAYAHNKQILVKQGQTVKRGQRIAEVGRTDASEPMLHFELRRDGLAVDPLAYLPPR